MCCTQLQPRGRDHSDEAVDVHMMSADGIEGHAAFEGQAQSVWLDRCGSLVGLEGLLFIGCILLLERYKGCMLLEPARRRQPFALSCSPSTPIAATPVSKLCALKLHMR